jgi:hypothetical protein
MERVIRGSVSDSAMKSPTTTPPRVSRRHFAKTTLATAGGLALGPLDVVLKAAETKVDASGPR